MVRGGVTMAELSACLDLTLEPPRETISVWFGQRLAETAKPGDVVREHGITFTVGRVRRGRVFEVTVSRDREGNNRPGSQTSESGFLRAGEEDFPSRLLSLAGMSPDRWVS